MIFDECVLLNTFNGSCLKIDESVAKAVADCDYASLDKDRMKIFSQAGILIQDNISEENIN